MEGLVGSWDENIYREREREFSENKAETACVEWWKDNG